MNLKKIIAFLIIAIILFLGGQYAVKKYVFPYKYQEYIEKYSEEYDLDPLLVLAVMKAESGFDKDSTSNKGAKGLMQIMDSTGNWIAGEIGVQYFMPYMLYDAETNIKFGCWYLKNLNTQFSDLNTALAAYNAGSGNVTEWLADNEYSDDGVTLKYIPFNETKKYVDKINVNYKIYQYLYGDE